MAGLGVKVWPRTRSVREDWVAWLTAEKNQLFDAFLKELETFYSMLSIWLDEAFTLSAGGRLFLASQQAGRSAELFDRLALRLLVSLHALEEHGRHSGTLPHVVALNPNFFRGQTAQQIAWKSNFLHSVLFSGRLQFFHKLQALTETVEELRKEFREAAEEISEGASVHPRARWKALDVLHYDLNTCLRETIVVLKSFLCALPNEQLEPLRRKLQPSLRELSSPTRLLRGSS